MTATLRPKVAAEASTPSARPARRPVGWLGALPFFAFMAVFLIIPVAANLVETFKGPRGFTVDPLREVFEPQYFNAFVDTINISLLTALVGGLFGTLLAWALATTDRPVWLKNAVMSFSSLASQSGGVPLAYAFIALLGSQGLVNTVVPGILGDFKLASFGGVAVVYLYFQVPLMAVLMLPAFAGIQAQWQQAARSLGATGRQYVFDILLPLLWPSALGSLLVLFANSFAAYATAYALAGGGLNLVPILIGFFISGNVMLDSSFAAALVTVMMVIITVVMIARALLEKRSSRWLAQ